LLPLLPRPGGKVVFISSVVSALACPDYAVYGATKAALDGLARNLRLELRDEIAVQVIHPGATRTGMHAKSGLSRQQMNWDKFPPAEQVAGQIAAAIDRNRSAVTIGLGNRVLQLSGRYFGGLVDAALRRRG
jgi:short-subunit dehydrogenase